MSEAIPFDVKFVPVGTGVAVWDDPYVDQVIHRFMPQDRKHGPMLGVVQMGAARPTPGVLRNLVVTVGEDVKAGPIRQFLIVHLQRGRGHSQRDWRYRRVEKRCNVRLLLFF